MEEQHKKTIEEANTRLNALIAHAEAGESHDPAQPVQSPQSAWVTGNDDERFLMLNEEAVDVINAVIGGIKDVVELLAKRESGDRKQNQ